MPYLDGDRLVFRGSEDVAEFAVELFDTDGRPVTVRVYDATVTWYPSAEVAPMRIRTAEIVTGRIVLIDEHTGDRLTPSATGWCAYDPSHHDRHPARVAELREA